MKPLPRVSGHPVPYAQSCDETPNRCVECPLHKSMCGGCIPSGKRDENSDNFCMQADCMTDCNGCGGAMGAVTPAICCKSSLKYIAWPELDKWRDPHYRPPWWSRLQDSSPLSLSNRGIIVTQANTTSFSSAPYHKDTETVAVSMRHLHSSRGWISDDLKDFLQLPPGVKLMALTSMKDDILERLWDKGVVGGQDFHDHGIDYWMPLMFSNYTVNGQMQNAYMAIRSLEACAWGQSQFLPINWAQGLYGYNLVLEAATKVKNAIFNAQFIHQTKRNWLLKLAEVVRWHHILPPDVSFFIIGLSLGSRIVTMRAMLHPRPVHFLSTSPWIGATRGKYYSTSGVDKKVAKTASREQLLHQNQANFFELCTNYELPPLSQEQTEWKQLQKDAVDALEKRSYLPPQ